MIHQLPNEIIIEILRSLSVRDCVALARTHQQLRWIFNDVRLWSHRAAQNYQMSRQLFERDLATSRSAWTHYRTLFECRHVKRGRWGRSGQALQCRNWCVPGTDYCHQHCIEKSIPLCQCGVDRSVTLCPTCQCHYHYQKGGCCVIGPPGPQGLCWSTDKRNIVAVNQPNRPNRPVTFITPSKSIESRHPRSYYHR
jgi:hypothetical protein